MSDEGGADPHTVLGLVEIDSPGIRIDGGLNLPATGQGMQDVTVGLESFEVLGLQAEAAVVDGSLGALVPFVLDASHVYGVDVGKVSADVLDFDEGGGVQTSER